MFELKSRVALVTGGTRGIGAAIARHLLEEGAQVVVNGRNEDDEVRATVDELKSLGDCTATFCNVASAEGARTAVNTAVETYGGLDILIHGAGGPAPGRITDLSEEDWYSAFDIHVHPVFHLFRAAHPHLKKAPGVMLLVSSVAGIRGCPGTVAYQTVKGALPQLARALAVDHGDEGIRINVIAPGIIRTRFHAAMTPEAKERNLRHRIPLHREGTVEDVATASLELIRNDFITGEMLVVDGGMSMRVV